MALAGQEPPPVDAAAEARSNRTLCDWRWPGLGVQATRRIAQSPCQRPCSISAALGLVVKTSTKRFITTSKKKDVRLLLRLVVLLHLSKQLPVDFHKQLERIKDHAVYCPVPVRFRIDKQGREHDREDDLDVLRHEIENVFVVPVE